MVVLILNMNLSWPQVLEGDKAGGVSGTGASLAMAESVFFDYKLQNGSLQ